MSSTKLYSITKSFIIVPLVATAISMNAFTASVNNAIAPIIAQTEVSAEEAKLQVEREEKAAKIDAYFAKRNMPLAGTGMKMVIEAEKNNIDWRIIPALAVRESTGGKHACKSVTYSPFGFGSCKINFKSWDHAIEIVATNLGGNNPRTARAYGGKTLRGKLEAYNPPSVVPTYANEVIALMNKIEATVVIAEA
ncbi:MAG: hypothetical protein ACOYMZ_00250 [Minisyncoccia bacterium]